MTFAAGTRQRFQRRRPAEAVERLAAAYRAGELPDYMLEFVDSLKTRANQPSS